MKKRGLLILLAAFLCLVCVFMLAACDESDTPNAGDGSDPIHTHAWGEWQVETEATCQSLGKETRTCNCGESETRTIPATGHHYNTDNICIDCNTELQYSNSLLYELNQEENAYTVVGMSEMTTVVVIPNYYKGLPITCIAEGAFDNCGFITDLQISATISNIEGFLFGEGLSGLSSVSVEKGNAVYYSVDNCVIQTANKTLVLGCKNSIIPTDGSVTKLGDTAFVGCIELTEITIPSKITEIGMYAFASCINLTSITIPARVTSIGERAFDGCEKLIEVYNLSSIDVAGYFENVKMIHTTATAASKLFTDENGFRFYDDGVERYLMGYNGNDTALVLPTSCNGNNYAVWDYAFYGHSEFQSVTIPVAARWFGNEVFRGCENVKAVYYTGDVASWCNIYFYYIHSNPLAYGADLYMGGDLVTFLEIPNGVTEIKECAFFGCTSIISVTIPASVTAIGSSNRAFQDCYKLIEVYNLSPLNIRAGESWYDNGSIGTYAKNVYTASQGESKLFTDDNGFIFYDDGTNRYLLDYIGTDTALTLPVGCKGNNYKIYELAFCHRNDLTSITIPDGVTGIGVNAFSGCVGIVQVENGVSYVDKWIVGCDTGVTTVTLRSNTVGICTSAFEGCRNLISISIPASVRSIGDSAFYQCYNLTTVNCGDNNQLTNIGDKAFFLCNGLTTMNFGTNSQLTTIGYEAFSYCDSLTTLTIPAKVTNIGDYAFVSCSNLTTVNFHDNSELESIGEYAFEICSSLTTVNFGDNSQLTTLGAGLFSRCNSLTSITIPPSVTSIGKRAFEFCNSLTAVYITDIAAWCNIEFDDYNNNPLYYAQNLYFDNTLITHLEIPNTVTSIKNYAFYGCTSIISVTIPASVTSIGNSAFYECEGLTGAIFEDNSQLTSIGNFAFYECEGLTRVVFGDNSQLTSIDFSAFYNCRNLSTVDFGENSQLTSIGNNAFSNCENLTSIMIPTNVTNIGFSAFSGCFKLIEIYDLSTALEITAGSWDYGDIGRYAEIVHTTATVESKVSTDDNGYIFYDDNTNRYLVGYTGTDTALTLPASCNGNNYKINRYAFYKCDDLTNVVIPSSVTSIGSWAFAYCDSLASVTFKDNSQLKSIDSYAFESCDSLTSITIPASVISIYEQAFLGCFRLIEVYDLSTVLEITAGSDLYGQVGKYAKIIHTTSTAESKLFTDSNDYVFYDDGTNRYLMGYTGTDTVLILPTSCNGNSYEIWQYAFSRCQNLTSITIPASVTSIGEGAFSGCENLTTVTFADNSQLTRIDNYTFGSCHGLTSIIIPASVTNIGESAFSNCTSLTAVALGENSQLTTIGTRAFSWCDSLTAIILPVNVMSIGENAFEYCYNLFFVYYGGRESDWNNISIFSSNYYLTDAPRYYYSENSPTMAGNWWHYDNDGKPIVWPSVAG